MDGLIWIVVLLAVISAVTGKAKKRAAQKPPFPPFPTAEPDAGEAYEDEEVPSEVEDICSRIIAEVQPSGSMAPPERHEGECVTEHREHRQRVLEEEQRIREEREERLNLGQLRRQRLREAIVMNEILDKPVALRARRRWS